MKVIYIFRDSLESRYLLSKFKKNNTISKVIVEKGNKAKKLKMKRTFKNVRPWLFPVKILDLISLSIYTFVSEYLVAKNIAKDRIKDNDIDLFVDDINEDKCISFIKKNNPDLIFIYGTAIIKKDTLNAIKGIKIINIHSGIVPFYRNVHSDFWAHYNNDLTNIGISLIHLDEGVDSGNVAFQIKTDILTSDNIIAIKIKNIYLIENVIPNFIKKYNDGKIGNVKQSLKEVGFYKTPSVIDFLKYYKRIHLYKKRRDKVNY